MVPSTKFIGTVSPEIFDKKSWYLLSCIIFFGYQKLPETPKGPPSLFFSLLCRNFCTRQMGSADYELFTAGFTINQHWGVEFNFCLNSFFCCGSDLCAVSNFSNDFWSHLNSNAATIQINILTPVCQYLAILPVKTYSEEVF